MGQKVNPVGIRLGIVHSWNAQWFSQKNTFSVFLKSDIFLRQYIKEKFLRKACISKIFIERTGINVKITIYTSKPGVVIGERGADIDSLRVELNEKYNYIFSIRIKVIQKADLCATLVSESIAVQLEQRTPFRRVLRKAALNSLKQGAIGIKISIAGRLGGADIARVEWYREGRVPLHTFNANIDYDHTSAFTKYGVIGVKVWLYRPFLLLTKDSNGI